MPAVQVRHYIQRATDFLLGMQLMRDDRLYWNSVALLAIHSAVSYSNALRSGLGDQQLSADDHQKTVDNLKKLLPSKGMDDHSGLVHLQYLTSKKNLVAYGNERLSENELLRLANKAERFAKWANKVGRQLDIEGWKHDDQ